jgi:uncharacterized protein
MLKASDRNHQRVLAVAQGVSEPLVLPVVVLPEVCYLIAAKLGYQALCRFVSNVHMMQFRVNLL